MPAGRNPFDGFTPSVPHGEKLDFASPEYCGLELAGLEAAGRSAFVLVAGGLGERLGYSGARACACGCGRELAGGEAYCMMD